MDARKPARESAKRDIARRASAPADLSALLDQVDAAADAIAGSPARLELWAEEHLEFGIKLGRASEMARQVIDYLTVSGSNPEVNLSELASAGYPDDENSARGSSLRAAVAELNALHADGIVSDDERDTLTTTLEEIIARVRKRPGRPASPGAAMGGWLMSLMLAVGYGIEGRNYRAAPEYSADAAAEIVRRIVSTIYKRQVSKQGLKNAASKQRTVVRR